MSSENKTIHQVGELFGIPSVETTAIIAEVRANSARLEQCPCHDFNLCQDRHTKQFTENPTPWQRFGAKWLCAHCGGTVSGQEKLWYERGLAHASKGQP